MSSRLRGRAELVAAFDDGGRARRGRANEGRDRRVLVQRVEDTGARSPPLVDATSTDDDNSDERGKPYMNRFQQASWLSNGWATRSRGD